MALRLGDPMAVDVAYADEVLFSNVPIKLLLRPLYFVVIIPYPITHICSLLGRYP